MTYDLRSYRVTDMVLRVPTGLLQSLAGVQPTTYSSTAGLWQVPCHCILVQAYDGG